MENFVPTLSWMSAKFNEFNAIYFDNKLPIPVFTIKNLGSRCFGRFSIKHCTCGFANCIINKYTYNTIHNIMEVDPEILLTNAIGTSVNQVENTLIHEMCHFYTVLNCRYPKQWHGKEFKAKCADIMARSHNKYNLGTYHTDKNWEFVDDKVKASVKTRKENKKNNAIMLLITMTDGTKRVIFTSNSLKESMIDKVTNSINKPSLIQIGGANCVAKSVAKYGNFRSCRTYKYYHLHQIPMVIDYLKEDLIESRVILSVKRA